MGDILLPDSGTPWTSLSPPRLPTLATLEANINESTLSTAIKTEVTRGIFNVKAEAYGATGDGSTDDSSAIQAAIDAAEVSGGLVYLPQGTYLCSTRLVIDSSLVHLCGDGVGTSILKADTGLASLLNVGITASASTQVFYVTVHDLTLDGNSTCTDAVMKVFNASRCKFYNLRPRNGVNHGLRSHTYETSGDSNTKLLRNEYFNIESDGNGDAGFVFEGEKDTRFSDLLSRDNTTDGFQFLPFVEGSGTPALAETTTCVLSNLLARDNSGDGFVFDMVSKFACGQLVASINGGAGLRIQTENSSATSKGANDFQISTFISRNNAEGGIVVDEDALTEGSQIGNAWIVGSTVDTGAPGIDLQGVREWQFGNVFIRQLKGDDIRIRNGTSPGYTESSRIQFGNIFLRSTLTANSTSGDDHGVQIEDSSEDIYFGCLQSIHENTTSARSNYEVDISATATSIFIEKALLDAKDAGNEINIASGAEDQVKIGLLQPESAMAAPTVASAATITLPPGRKVVNISGTTNITDATSGPVDDVVTLVFAGVLTFTDGNNLNLDGNFTTAANDTITIASDGSTWHEVCRSQNST